MFLSLKVDSEEEEDDEDYHKKNKKKRFKSDFIIDEAEVRSSTAKGYERFKFEELCRGKDFEISAFKSSESLCYGFCFSLYWIG